MTPEQAYQVIGNTAAFAFGWGISVLLPSFVWWITRHERADPNHADHDAAWGGVVIATITGVVGLVVSVPIFCSTTLPKLLQLFL